MKKVSIIVPTFNRARILAACLDSLVSQDYDRADFEVIIVDNNSTDGTRCLSESYISGHPGFNIRYALEQRPGLVFARHAGVKQARHEILSFIDDDSIACKSWLKELAAVFESNPEVAAVAGKINIRWDTAPPEWVIPYEPLLGKLDYGNEIKIERGLFINGSNFNIKKDALLKVGGFNPDQIGDWLVGDGEYGLCRKLHEAGYWIGWSPKALVEHCQAVARHATYADIERRFMNNGVSVPYQIFVLKRKGGLALLLNLLRSLVCAVSRQLAVCVFFMSGNKSRRYHAGFERAYYTAQFPYTWRILRDKTFREYLLRTDWF